MEHNIYIYILVTFLVTYLIRVLPLTLIRKPIKNKFIRSFLFYVPYVTLAVMTFPAIIYATSSIYSGILALLAGLIIAWFNGNLFLVAFSSCAIVFIAELFIKWLEKNMRIDKYLKISRLIKRRTIANEACDAGRIFVNSKLVKASYDVKVGDIIEIKMGERVIKVEVLQVLEHALKNDASSMYKVL